tara:strand:+ start:82 stop:246 length:165 start_codon:yes stop_codon:yes gene_type:complete
MARIVVRIPEPKDDYEVSNQRQINRGIASLIEELNTSYQQNLKEEQERIAFFFG